MGKLGQLLVTRGWITVQQLTRALQNQGVVGGRLGTCLLEMDALSEDNLLRALSEQLGVPAASLDDLRGIPEEVLGLIPDKLARRCRAVPFRLEGSRLDLAMMDARNLSCQDEIAFASGKRVKVHVAHELRILEALERYYKEECPSRFSLLAERLNRARYFWERDRAARAERSDRSDRSDTAATLASPFDPLQANDLQAGGRPRPASLAPMAAPPHLPDPIRAPAATRIAPPPAPAPPAPIAPAAPETEPAPPPARAPRPTSVPLSAEERALLGVTPPPPQTVPASIEEAEAVLATCHDREEVGSLVLAYLLLDHRRAALFQVSKDKITAWQGRGDGIDPAAFQRFSVGFDQPSLFLNLRQGNGVYLGPLPPMPAHRELASTWGGELPRDCVMLPLRLKERLVAVMYADGSKKVDLVQLQRLAAAAASALGRSILFKKQGEVKP